MLDIRFLKKISTFVILMMLALVVFSLQGQAQAQNVQTNLVSEHKNLVKGANDNVVNYIGIYSEIAPHWHTYWKNPGDSGLELRLNWETPSGVEVGDIIWPTPDVIPFQGLVNYGYEGAHLFAVPVHVPADFVGDHVTLKVDANWLVCKEACIPESASHEITLSISEPGEQLVPSVNKVLFDQAREEWPVAYDRPTYFAYSMTGDFQLYLTHFDNDGLRQATFFPYEWGVLDYTSPQSWSIEKSDRDEDVFILNTGSSHRYKGDAVEGVLKLGFKDAEISYLVRAVHDPDFIANAVKEPVSFQAADEAERELSSTNATDQTADSLDLGLSFYEILFYAFIGGALLNLMPCVFPVLFIKAMGLINHAHDDKNSIRLNGLSYAAGVIISFLVVGGALVILRALGENIGWGFQLQSPLMVTAFATLFFLVAMNMAGLFEFGGRIMQMGGRFSVGDGYGGSFLTGVLAVIVATPCSVPYMASAVGATIFLPMAQSLMVFVILGLGLSFPYLLLTFIPVLTNLLPKPGAWMDSFKKFLTFPMLASALWLYFVLVGQAGPYSAIAAMAISILFLLFFWLLERQELFSEVTKTVWSVVGLGTLFYVIAGNAIKLPICVECLFGAYGWAIVTIIVLGTPLVFTRAMMSVIWFVLAALLSYHIAVSYIYVDHTQTEAISHSVQSEEVGHNNYVAYDAKTLEELRAKGEKVFVNMTADWCITCLANEKATLSKASVKQAFIDNAVTYMKGDWTEFDPSITDFLKEYRRSGVPLYVYYNGKAEPIILPQILSEDEVIKTLQK